MLSLGRPPTKPLDVIPLHFAANKFSFASCSTLRDQRVSKGLDDTLMRQLRLGYPDAKAKLKRIASAEQRALRGESEPARRHAAALK